MSDLEQGISVNQFFVTLFSLLLESITQLLWVYCYLCLLSYFWNCWWSPCLPKLVLRFVFLLCRSCCYSMVSAVC